MALSEVERLTRSVCTMAEELEQMSERNKKLESYLRLMADDIEYQERRIEKGYDVEDRIIKRVAQYREIYPKEGEE